MTDSRSRSISGIEYMQGRLVKNRTTQNPRSCSSSSKPRAARHLPDGLSYTQVALFEMSDQLQSAARDLTRTSSLPPRIASYGDVRWN